MHSRWTIFYFSLFISNFNFLTVLWNPEGSSSETTFYYYYFYFITHTYKPNTIHHFELIY